MSVAEDLLSIDRLVATLVEFLSPRDVISLFTTSRSYTNITRWSTLFSLICNNNSDTLTLLINPMNNLFTSLVSPEELTGFHRLVHLSRRRNNHLYMRQYRSLQVAPKPDDPEEEGDDDDDDDDQAEILCTLRTMRDAVPPRFRLEHGDVVWYDVGGRFGMDVCGIDGNELVLAESVSTDTNCYGHIVPPPLAEAPLSYYHPTFQYRCFPATSLYPPSLLPPPLHTVLMSSLLSKSNRGYPLPPFHNQLSPECNAAIESEARLYLEKNESKYMSSDPVVGTALVWSRRPVEAVGVFDLDWECTVYDADRHRASCNSGFSNVFTPDEYETFKNGMRDKGYRVVLRDGVYCEPMWEYRETLPVVYLLKDVSDARLDVMSPPPYVARIKVEEMSPSVCSWGSSDGFNVRSAVLWSSGDWIGTPTESTDRHIKWGVGDLTAAVEEVVESQKKCEEEGWRVVTFNDIPTWAQRSILIAAARCDGCYLWSEYRVPVNTLPGWPEDWEVVLNEEHPLRDKPHWRVRTEERPCHLPLTP